MAKPFGVDHGAGIRELVHKFRHRPQEGPRDGRKTANDLGHADDRRLDLVETCERSGNLHRTPHAPRQILDELEGHAARAAAARGGPFQRLPMQALAVHLEAEMGGIGVDHAEIIILAAFMDAKPEPETI